MDGFGNTMKQEMEFEWLDDITSIKKSYIIQCKKNCCTLFSHSAIHHLLN